jgi:hypothetical protein
VTPPPVPRPGQSQDSERQERLRALRVEAAALGYVVNTQDFWDVAANAIRFQSAELARRKEVAT